jgi:hypothetical protein
MIELHLHWKTLIGKLNASHLKYLFKIIRECLQENAICVVIFALKTVICEMQTPILKAIKMPSILHFLASTQK